MSAFEKPQIIAHIQKGLNYTVFDCKWMPCSAKFVTMGNFARGTGVIQLYEIQHGDLKLLREVGAGRDLPSLVQDPGVPLGGECGLGVWGLHYANASVQCPATAPLEPRGRSGVDRRWSIYSRRTCFSPSSEFSSAGESTRALPAPPPAAPAVQREVSGSDGTSPGLNARPFGAVRSEGRVWEEGVLLVKCFFMQTEPKLGPVCLRVIAGDSRLT